MNDVFENGKIRAFLVLVLAIAMTSIVIWTVLATSNSGNEPTTGFEEQGTYFEIYHADGTHDTSFTTGETIYVKITSPSLQDINKKNQWRLNDLAGNNIAQGTFTWQGNGVATAQITAPTNAGHYYLEIQLQDNAGTTVKVADSIAVSDTTQYIKLYKDSGYTIEGYDFQTTDTIYIKAYASGTVDGANSKVEVDDYFNNKQQFQLSQLTWSQNGNYVYVELPLTSVTGITLNNDDWFWIKLDLQDANKNKIGRHAAQFYIGTLGGGANDTSPPAITFTGQTPADGATVTTSSVTVEITANESLQQALLNWNGVNYTMSGSGTSWSRTMSGLTNGTYTYKVYGQDLAGNWGVSATRTVTVSLSGGAGNAVLRLNLSRYVILDEPALGTAGTGFQNPPSNNAWTTDEWNGNATTVWAYALVVDKNGGVSGVSVTFTLKDPGGNTVATQTVQTDASGVAVASFDLNNQYYWGKWTVEASATVGSQTLTASRQLNYDWWGCAACHSFGSGKFVWNNVGTFTQKSPYTMGYDFHKNPLRNDHINLMTNGQCVACHQSYDDSWHSQSQSKPPNPPTPEYPAGIHNNKKTCLDCHVNAETGNNRAEIPGCYDTSGCHAQLNTKLTSILTTTGYSVGGTYSTVYSLDTTTGQPSKGHTPSQTVPCLSCHGPAHLLSKPVTTGTSNSYTEDEQCLTCHTGKGKHSTSNPVYCTACHSQDAHSIGILDKTQTAQNSPVYTTIGSQNAVSKTSCTDCHSAGGVADFFGSLTTYDSQAYTTDYTPATDSFGYTIAMHNGTVSCTVCHDATDFHNIKFLTHTGTYSTNKNQAVGCEDCHVPGVNDSVKTVVQNKGYNPPQVNAEHNGTVPCDVCHSPSPHGGPRFLQSDLTTYGSRATAVTCTDCHINTNAAGKTYTTRTGTYTMNPPYLGSNAFQHGNASWEGQNWGSYWTKADDNSACIYCHDNGGNKTTAIHKSPAFGTISYVNGGATDLSGSWCANCHVSSTNNANYNGSAFNPNPPTIDLNNTGKATNSAGSKWYNHTSVISSQGFADSVCKQCHGSLAQSATTIGGFVHQVAEGKAGGPDCVSCHDIGGLAPKHVDVSVMNKTTYIHYNLNSGATNTTQLSDPIDKACWACHGDGSEPSEHPANYKNPKKCEDCHINTNSATNFSAPQVSEHYYNGQDLVVQATCQDCHSKSEMLNTNNDPDAGSTNATISHYGKKRSDLVINLGGGDFVTNCYYCHQNSTTVFKNVMQNANHSYMYNHSDSPNSPRCWECHEVGRIHDQNHRKPVISNSLCLGCHRNGIGNLGPIPSAHNATMSCYSCHMDKSDTTYNSVTAQIHGIKYINSDGSYTRWDKTNAANCVDCHMNANTSSSLSAWGYTIPTIPKLNHSNDPIAGQKWGNYWTSTVKACYYCHQNEIHKNTNGLLGNVTLVMGNNTIGQQISGGTWCANCHYTSAPEYNGSALNPVPPRIDQSMGTANDGTSWVNHTGFLSTGYTDDVCKGCHGSLASSATQIKDFVHNVAEGTGGGCKSCHEGYTDGAKGINTSSFGRHANVDTSDGTNNLTDADCTTCHYDTSNMFDPGWSVSTYSCEDCHINGTPVSVPSDVQLSTFKHGNNDCKSCHIAGGFNSSKYYHWNYSTPYGAVKEPGWTGWSGTVVSCQDCHYSHSKRDEPFFAPGIGTFMATRYTYCGGGNCHGSGEVHNSVSSPYMYKPTVRISISNPYEYVGNQITATAEVIGYAVQIYNASYKLVHNGTTIAEGPLTPDDGEFGGVNNRGYGYEKFTINIDTTGFDIGEYKLYVTGEKDTGLKATRYATFTLAKSGIVPSPTAYNFGFEKWTLSNTPVNWNPNSVSVTQGTARTGNYSATLSTTGTGYLESAKFNITAQASYRVTVYVNKSLDGGYAGISVVQYNGNNIISETPVVKLEGYTSGWVLLGIDLVANQSATDFSIKLYVNNSTASFDDVGVQIKPFLTTNYVVNGGFDSNWGRGRPDKYFRSYEYRQTPKELIKAWEPKEMTSSEMDINTTVSIGTRSAGIKGAGYWTTPYNDLSYYGLRDEYIKYYGINLGSGTEFTTEFMIYSDRMNGSAGVQFIYRNVNDVGDTAGRAETYKVIITQPTDWMGVITSGKMPSDKQYLQLKLFSEGSNHVLFDEVAVY